MHRDGADPDNMNPEDFLCDFCGQPWREDRPFVEGHRGSCICGNCLAIAYTAIVLNDGGEPMPATASAPGGEGAACALCLQPKAEEAHWPSPVFEDKFVCARCVRQSAGVLHKDPEIAWRKPGSPSPR